MIIGEPIHKSIINSIEETIDDNFIDIFDSIDYNLFVLCRRGVRYGVTDSLRTVMVDLKDDI
jgi:hypothetical protein